jgi:hypothetical protein
MCHNHVLDREYFVTGQSPWPPTHHRRICPGDLDEEGHPTIGMVGTSPALTS